MSNESTQHETPIDLPVLRFAERDLELILKFLAVCLTKAETNFEKCIPDDRRLCTHPCFQNQLRYWRNVCSGIKWIGHLATKRQIHLGIETDPELDRKVELWINQSLI